MLNQFLSKILFVLSIFDVVAFDKRKAIGKITNENDPADVHEIEYESDYIDDVAKAKLKIDDPEIQKNIDCDEFTIYSLNCTITAALMFNSSAKAPPMPDKINLWCDAIKHLTLCAVDWNTDCGDVTNSHFNEESISGHNYVINNICDDEKFLEKYNKTSNCIEGVSPLWESCYLIFSRTVDATRNTTHKEWTHYESHFYMCCARAKFRRCTFDAMFHSIYCSKEEAITLQKFTVFVSEGDVYQDCQFNMNYELCPGGDPRPEMFRSDRVHLTSNNKTSQLSIPVLGMFIFLIFSMTFWKYTVL